MSETLEQRVRPIQVDPRVGQAIARGWDWQRRRKVRFLEWLRRNEACSNGVAHTQRHASPESAVLDWRECSVWFAEVNLRWLVNLLLGRGEAWRWLDANWSDFESSHDALAQHLLASPQWAQIFEGVSHE